ncbi:MAG: hypothetical protein ACK4G3_00325, partial [bacterium]
ISSPPSPRWFDIYQKEIRARRKKTARRNSGYLHHMWTFIPPNSLFICSGTYGMIKVKSERGGQK